MRTYIKILLIALFACLVSYDANAQTVSRLKYSPDKIIGTWQSTVNDDGVMYEIELKTEMSTSNNYTLELVIGKVKYIKNGVTIRETEFDGINSIIYGSGIKSDTKIVLDFVDEVRKVWWIYEFELQGRNSDVAILRELRAHENLFGNDWNINKPDFAVGQAFKKID